MAVGKIQPQGSTSFHEYTGDATIEGDVGPNGVIVVNSASPVTLTLPAESEVNWPLGTVLHIVEKGDGAVTVAAPAGETLDGTAVTVGKGDILILIKTGTGLWDIALAT